MLSFESIEENAISADAFPNSRNDTVQVGSPNSLEDWQDYLLGHNETSGGAMSSDFLTSRPGEESYPTQMDPYVKQQILNDFQV